MPKWKRERKKTKNNSDAIDHSLSLPFSRALSLSREVDFFRRALSALRGSALPVALVAAGQKAKTRRRRSSRRRRRASERETEEKSSGFASFLKPLSTSKPKEKNMPPCPLASPDRPPIEAILFDLDDTLYRIEAIPERVRENIEGKVPILLFIPRPSTSSFRLLFLTSVLFLHSLLPPQSHPSLHGRQAQDRPGGRPGAGEKRARDLFFFLSVSSAVETVFLSLFSLSPHLSSLPLSLSLSLLPETPKPQPNASASTATSTTAPRSRASSSRLTRRTTRGTRRGRRRRRRSSRGRRTERRRRRRRRRRQRQQQRQATATAAATTPPSPPPKPSSPQPAPRTCASSERCTPFMTSGTTGSTPACPTSPCSLPAGTRTTSP